MPSHINFFKTSDKINIRYGIWPSQMGKKGSVVLLSGRSEFLEKYEEPIQCLNQRNFDVYSIDWRGQGLASRLLPNRQKGYVEKFDDYLNDLKEIYDKLIRPSIREPAIFMGHSMGGHVAIRFAHDRPDDVDRLILTAPMVDINFKPFPKFVVKQLTRIMTALGKADRYALGSKDYRVIDQQFRGNKLTSDPIRFFDHINAVKKNPDLALGGVTFGWLNAAFDSIDVMRSPGFAQTIEMPVLMAVAQKDRVVSRAAQEELCGKIPDCRIRLINNARHEILKEVDEIQKQFWEAFDNFTG